MYVLIGSGIVLASVLGGYLANGGHLDVLIQPFEVLIIVGAAIGGFITSNRKPVLNATAKAIPALLKPEKHDKEAYLELLSMLYSVFKLAKTKGALGARAACARSPRRARSSSASRNSMPTITPSPSCATICASSPSAPTTITRWKR